MADSKIERVRIDSVDAFSVSASFITIEGKGYTRKKFTPTSDVSHLEIYQYVSEKGDKFTFVYDTVAKILTVDGKAAAITELKPFLPKSQKPQPIKGKQVITVAQKPQPKQQKQTPKKKQSEPQKKEQDKPKKPAPPKQQTATIKNVGVKRLEWLIKDLGESRVKVRTTQQDKAKVYALSSGKESVELRREEGGLITLKGAQSGLYNEVKTKLESKSDLKLLKKYVPTALRYLSESSKIDLSNGISDLNNVVRLFDYSVLLMAPCRALEKFIYDLEHAQNINVNMIGQAYEKDDNDNYLLKKGYLKRIRSVIYSEVMTALYTEYCTTRNFYLHSDNSADSKSRGISDKAEAQRILNRLLSVIEYNSIKLSEIGFTVEGEQ